MESNQAADHLITNRFYKVQSCCRVGSEHSWVQRILARSSVCVIGLLFRGGCAFFRRPSDSPTGFHHYARRGDKESLRQARSLHRPALQHGRPWEVRSYLQCRHSSPCSQKEVHAKLARHAVEKPFPYIERKVEADGRCFYKSHDLSHKRFKRAVASNQVCARKSIL